MNLKAKYLLLKTKLQGMETELQRLGDSLAGLGAYHEGALHTCAPPCMCMVEWIWGGGLFHQILYDVGKNLTLSKGMFFSFFLIFFTPKICMVLCAKIPNFCKKRKINFDIKRRVFYSFKLF